MKSEEKVHGSEPSYSFKTKSEIGIISDYSGKFKSYYEALKWYHNPGKGKMLVTLFHRKLELYHCGKKLNINLNHEHILEKA